MGSTNEDGFLGTLSDAGCFSLAPTKIITSGQGGFVLTHSKDIFEQIIRLKDHGRLSRQSDRHPVTGFNFKLTDMQAALALAQFRRLPERIERARDIDNTYQEGLSGVGDIQFPPRPEGDGYLMWPDFTSEKRDALVTYMKERDIHLRPFWPALHTQDAYRVDDAFPGAKTACATACWLPCSPHITDAQIERVIDTVQGFFAAQRRS
jgi:dTDP-4-amino-4,6-dideoxygalactose transaminase